MENNLNPGATVQPAVADPNGHVHDVIRSVHQELLQLVEQRAAITRRIGTMKQTLMGLVTVFGETTFSGDLGLMDSKPQARREGITVSCRRALMHAGGPVTAREVLDFIRQTTPEVLANHKNPLVGVTSILSRLAEYGEARISTDLGRRVWQWSGDMPPGGPGAPSAEHSIMTLATRAAEPGII
jgi:hypothetical protein